jgi:hypothetical protein
VASQVNPCVQSYEIISAFSVYLFGGLLTCTELQRTLSKMMTDFSGVFGVNFSFLSLHLFASIT